LFDWLETLISHQGYGVIFGVVFLNNLCLPIPGDAVVLGAGFLVGKGSMSLWGVMTAATAACFLGGNGAYWIGARFGRRLLKKIPWLQKDPKKIAHWERFSEKYGPKVVFFARFVALLHPVTGLLAGMWKTPLRPFLAYNLAGSFGYGVLYTMAGIFLGKRWEIFKTWLGPGGFYAILISAGLLTLFFFLRRAIRIHFADLKPSKK
jgi:membrane protein DedA with SNARE-associated domain